MTTGCVTDGNSLRPQPTLDQLATDQAAQSVTAVDVSRRCRALAAKVREPADKAGKNVYLSRRQWRASLRLANQKLGYTEECIDKLVEEYAKGLPPNGEAAR